MHEAAIVGAGPYGLSIAAHLRKRGVSFRIFGPPMQTWISHMPKGMCLKSDGFASNLYDPDNAFTLEKFCAANQIRYADMGVPVHLDTFSSYGLAFAEQMVPELENKLVVAIERAQDGEGFAIRLDTGETCRARRVVLAVGVTHFEYIPENLRHLGPEYLSHSGEICEEEQFKSKKVVVIGGGASALDTAALLHKAGAEVQLVARRTELRFHSGPGGKPRSWWKRLRHPDSGLGPGLRSWLCANAPWLFHYLPEGLRIELVKRTLGPAGGFYVRDLIVGHVSTLLGRTVTNAEVQEGRVRLVLQAKDGLVQELVADHVIAATGYRVNVDRLEFLSSELRSQIRTAGGAPALSRCLESTVDGLYFAGLASANSFGPVMRFAFGAGFAARQITRSIEKSKVRTPSRVMVKEATA